MRMPSFWSAFFRVLSGAPPGPLFIPQFKPMPLPVPEFPLTKPRLKKVPGGWRCSRYGVAGARGRTPIEAFLNWKHHRLSDAALLLG